MKIKSAELEVISVSKKNYPKQGLPEIALIGRSNVGKSSLINRICNRKKLAHTSGTPGKTRTINFYNINESLYLVDLPGHGYAKASGSDRKSWRLMIEEYFEEGMALKGALIILDSRRDVVRGDREVIEWLNSMELPFKIILTKADKLSKNKVFAQAAKIKKDLETGNVTLFSSHDGTGKDNVWKDINDLADA